MNDNPVADIAGRQASPEAETLCQRVGCTRRTYSLEPEFVQVEESQVLGRTRYRIDYSRLSGGTAEKTLYTGIWLGLGLFSLSGFLVSVLGPVRDGESTDPLTGGIIFGAFTFLFAILFWGSWARVVVLDVGGAKIFIGKYRPSGRSVEAFLKELMKRRDVFLANSYPFDSVEGPIGELQKLQWLKEQGALTDDEYEVLKRRIIEEEPTDPEPTGFVN